MNLEILRRRLAQLTEQRGTDRTRLTELLAIEPAQLSTDQRSEMDRLTAARTAAAPDIAALEAQIADEESAQARSATLDQANAAAGQTRAGGAQVTREERTYTRHKDSRGEASFFRDAFALREHNNPDAQQRLTRHLQEARTEGELSERATTTGTYAGLVVPQYLVDLAAPLLRTGRPTANLVQGLPLPAQGMSLKIPRGTTGAAVASQATQNTSLQNTDQAWADLDVPVVTVGGQQDVSRQSLERGTPGIDQLIYNDLGSAYHAEVNRQVVNGSGASNQMLGMLQTTGRNIATAYGAVITAGLFNLKVAGGIAAIAGTGSMLMPNLILANPRRWGWLNGLVDSAGRPLVVPGVGGPMNVLALNQVPGGYGGDGDPQTREVTVPGSLQGLPLVTDAGVPTAVGTNNEDVVVAMDRRHALLWEDGDGNPKQLRFEQTLGNQLTVKLVIYGYAAFTSGRYPAAISQIGGIDTTATFGQVQPAF